MSFFKSLESICKKTPILFMAISFIAFLLMLIGTVDVLQMVFSFIYYNPIMTFIIAVVVTGAGALIYGIKTGFYKEHGILGVTKPKTKPASIPQVATDNTYSLLRNVLFGIQQSKDFPRATGLLAVSSAKDLNVSPRFFREYGYILCRFSMLYSTSVDVDLIKKILQTRIIRHLETQDIDGIEDKQGILYNGVFYPSIMVHKVIDRGGSVEIMLTVTTETYLKKLEYRNAKKADTDTVITFDDEDF